jgi:lysozyme
VEPGDKTTPVSALVRLNDQAESFQRELRACIGDVPMHQHEWDAIVSWTFNVGSRAACGSTLVKKLRALDYAGACNELLRWDRFQGRRLAGLTKRRQAEHAQCMGAQ